VWTVENSAEVITRRIGANSAELLPGMTDKPEVTHPWKKNPAVERALTSSAAAEANSQASTQPTNCDALWGVLQNLTTQRITVES
jgi:hypothetical protein